MKKRLIKIMLCVSVGASVMCNTVPVMAVTGSISVGSVKRATQANSYSEKYDESQYKVGTDIPEGEYVLFAKNGAGYFCVSSDSNKDDIIQNDNFEYNSILTVNAGTYLDLVRCYAVPITDVSLDDIDLTGSGFFKAGLHFPAGEYKLSADENDTGYYAIYNDSTQENIVSNNNFTGDQYVTVSEGQYLKLVRCKFSIPPEKVVKTYTDTDTIKKVQELLNQKGYDCGNPDGVAGTNTKNAIIKYKKDNGLEENDSITEELLSLLKGSENENTAESTNSTTGSERSISDIIDDLKGLVQYSSISISDQITEGDAIGYKVLFNSSSIAIIGNPDNNGKISLGAMPIELDKESGSQDYLDFLAYFVEAIDGTIELYDGYVYVMNAYDNGTYEQNGINYDFSKTSLSFIATF